MPPEIRELYAEIGQLLNAATSATDPNDPNFLGEPWRSQLIEVKGQINASLSGLPETDKVAAAQEAKFGLDFLKQQLLNVQSIIKSLSGIVSAKNTERAQALASVTSEVEKGIEAKIKAGELLSKQAATDLAAQARKEGEEAGFGRGKLLADRRSALALAGLPAEVSAAAPEAVLLSEEAQFNTARDAAKDRVTKLQGVGLTVASGQMKTLPWGAQDAFDAQLAAFSEIQAAAKGQSNNSAPAKEGEKKPAVSGLAAAAAPAKAPSLTATNFNC
jgi:hypothetical protein